MRWYDTLEIQYAAQEATQNISGRVEFLELSERDLKGGIAPIDKAQPRG